MAARDLDVGSPGGAPGEEWAARQFHGQNLRIGRNRTVHRVSFLPDERGIELPVPHCHSGYFAAGRPWWKVYSPTSDLVSCGLCLDSRRGRNQTDDDGPHQLEFHLPH